MHQVERVVRLQASAYVQPDAVSIAHVGHELIKRRGGLGDGAEKDWGKGLFDGGEKVKKAIQSKKEEVNKRRRTCEERNMKRRRGKLGAPRQADCYVHFCGARARSSE